MVGRADFLSSSCMWGVISSSTHSRHHLFHLILQDRDGDGNKRHTTLHLLPATSQSFVGKLGFEERQA